MMCFICTIRNMTSNVVSSFFFYGHDYVETRMAQLIGLMALGISTGSYLRKRTVSSRETGSTWMTAANLI